MPKLAISSKLFQSLSIPDVSYTKFEMPLLDPYIPKMPEFDFELAMPDMLKLEDYEVLAYFIPYYAEIMKFTSDTESMML